MKRRRRYKSRVVAMFGRVMGEADQEYTQKGEAKVVDLL